MATGAAGSGATRRDELLGIAGGDDIFPARAAASLARERIVADPLEVVREAPDIVIGSWCGKKFRAEQVAARPGWSALPAVRDGELHEIKSPLILQPGPARQRARHHATYRKPHVRIAAAQSFS